jgi:hypothetical protein
MKNMLMVVALGISTACAAHAQNIVGDWQGALDTGQARLHLVLHITKGDDGGYKATLDSVDQGAIGIPVSSISLKDSKLNLTVDAVNGTYEGEVKADGSQVTGTWSQGQPLPLNFTRGAAPAKPEPKPAKPSDIDGTWQGTVDAGGTKLRAVFHITNTEEGLTATMDSPDQGANGIPVTTVTRSGSSLTMELKGIGGKFEGKIAGDLTSIDGTWSQGSGAFPLMLKR